MSEDNNLPAFPSTIRNEGDVVVHGFLGEEINPGMEIHYAGMSLRDYFAAKAMQGICSHHDTWGLGNTDIVTQAYKIADSMLAEREE